MRHCFLYHPSPSIHLFFYFERPAQKKKINHIIYFFFLFQKEEYSDWLIVCESGRLTFIFPFVSIFCSPSLLFLDNDHHRHPQLSRLPLASSNSVITWNEKKMGKIGCLGQSPFRKCCRTSFHFFFLKTIMMTWRALQLPIDMAYSIDNDCWCCVAIVGEKMNLVSLSR